MTPWLRVVDDFLPDAERFRQVGLRSTFSLVGPYPGRNSREQVEIAGLEEAVSALLNEPLIAMAGPGSHARFRLSLHAEQRPAKIHIDPSHWSGILYLSDNEHCHGGTEFYRHKPSGTERVPETLEKLHQAGYSSYDELQRLVVDGDAHHRKNWERTFTVPMRFNRLVLLHPQYWHTSGLPFGDRPENGRLVYLMFFRRRAS